MTGGMRFVGRFLSAAPWTPLARLSYAAYLVEFVCILPLYAYFSHGLATARTFSELVPILAADGAACVGLTFVVALFFHVLVEKPFVNLR
jgi:peptidoglycan/LPS O-acetylase OafA/YrhL